MNNSYHQDDFDPPLKIFIAAGEVSGDRQASYLARTILKQQPDVYLFGSGGEKMKEAGVDIRVQTSHLGCVGFQESLSFIRPLRAIMEQLRTLLLAERPDLAILVDNEGFNGLLAKFLYKEEIPFIYYFPPQVWLWGEWRAHTIAKRAHAIIPAFPQETSIYRSEGGNVEWFGHPLLDIVKPEDEYETILRASGIDPSRPILTIMPGSRFQEVKELTQSMLHAAQLIQQRYNEMQIVIPLAAPHLYSALENQLRSTNMLDRTTIVTNNVYTILSRSKLVLVSSGTATLETALLGIPMVVGYRVKPLTFFLGKRLIKTRFIAMPNILLNEKVVPELLQENANAQRFAEEALAILDNPGRASMMSKRLQQIRPILGQEGALNKAASFILHEARVVNQFSLLTSS